MVPLILAVCWPLNTSLFIDLPHFGCPRGFQSRECFVVLVSGFLSVWSIHFQRRDLMVSVLFACVYFILYTFCFKKI